MANKLIIKISLPLLLLLLLFSPIKTQTSTPQDQIEALQTFYNSLGGNYWFQSTNWNEGDPCSVTQPWFGVNCINVTAFDSSINSINLPFNNLTGELPNNLTSLTNLNYLYLNSNNISGTIPVTFYTNLPLYKLILGSNLLSGSISQNISSLTPTLSYFDLQMNKLSGTLPESFYQLHYLTGILLNGNQFSGTLSNYMQNFTKLQTFHVDTNKFTGSIPDNIYNLKTLTELFLGTNSFSGTISTSIGYLTNLEKLEISNTEIEGEIPSKIYSLTNLQYLNLGLNKLTGTISSSIGNLKQLTQLNLQSNQLSSNKDRFTGTVPLSLWGLTGLQYLYLSFNEFNGTIPSSVGNIAGLVVLDVGQNKFTGTIPSGIFNLLNLETLFLQENQFSGTLDNDLFEQLVNLENLLLNSNQITGTIPSTPFFMNFTLSGQNILSNNPFLCPIPSWASSQPLSADCQWWEAQKVTPQYGSTNGGTIITISGSKFTQLSSGLVCSFSNDSSSLSPLYSTANYINSTAIKCTTPPSSPTSNITNFGVSLYYNQQITTNPTSSSPIPYIYETTPIISSISPSNSMQQGGQLITVIGNNFAQTDQFNALFCSINNVYSSAVFVNVSMVTCASPDLNMTGVFPFKVTNDNGAHFSTSSVTIQYYSWCETDGNGVACSGQGACDNSTSPPTCNCNVTFTGQNCENCVVGYYGNVCTPCPQCVHGTCADGLYGTGICNCDWNWSGEVCDIPWVLITVVVLFIVFVCGLFLGAIVLITMFLRRVNAQKRLRTIERKIATENEPLINGEKGNSIEELSVEIEKPLSLSQPLHNSIHSSVEVTKGSMGSSIHNSLTLDRGKDYQSSFVNSYDDYATENEKMMKDDLDDLVNNDEDDNNANDTV